MPPPLAAFGILRASPGPDRAVRHHRYRASGPPPRSSAHRARPTARRTRRARARRLANSQGRSAPPGRFPRHRRGSPRMLTGPLAVVPTSGRARRSSASHRPPIRDAAQGCRLSARGRGPPEDAGSALAGERRQANGGACFLRHRSPSATMGFDIPPGLQEKHPSSFERPGCMLVVAVAGMGIPVPRYSTIRWWSWRRRCPRTSSSPTARGTGLPDRLRPKGVGPPVPGALAEGVPRWAVVPPKHVPASRQEARPYLRRQVNGVEAGCNLQARAVEGGRGHTRLRRVRRVHRKL